MTPPPTPTLPLRSRRVLPALLSTLFPLAMAGGMAAADLHVPASHPTVAEALAAASPGDTIVVAEGTHPCTAPLRVTGGVTVRGSGRDREAAERTILDFGGRAEAAGITVTDRSALVGLTVTGVGRFDEQQWQAEFERGGEGQSRDHLGGGIPAVAVVGAGARVENCVVRDNGGSGILVQEQGSDTDDPDRGGRFHPAITGNHCLRNMGAGISVVDARGGLVADNLCEQNFFAGIGHRNASPIVLDNTCRRNVRAGIGISEGSSPVVRGNTCHGNGRAGIGIRTGATTAPVVEGNHCRENAMAGIGCREGARPILRDNRCEHNGAAGIGARDDARPLAVGNTCHANEAAGIGLAGTAEAVLVANTCSDNRLVAVGLPDGARAVLVDNVLSRKGGMPPLVAIRGGSTAVLAGNSLTGGGVAAILLEGRAVLADNTLTADPDARSSHGIWIWKHSRAVLAGNTIDGFDTTVTSAEDTTVLTDTPSPQQ